MTKSRLDQELVRRGLVATRSQAASYIGLGEVEVNGRVVTKPGQFVNNEAQIVLASGEQYVSRAGLKLASVADKLGLDFSGKVVLDVGSSTGGFTDFALRHGAKKVIAVDVGTDQMHPKLRADSRVELHEKTDIRDVIANLSATNSFARSTENRDEIFLNSAQSLRAETSSCSRTDAEFCEKFPGFQRSREKNLSLVQINIPNIVVIDVSFISLREILPHIAKNLADRETEIVAMLKPQFETGARVKNDGVIKNDTERRKILHDFELWTRKYFIIKNKKDSEVAGATGNRERFYLLKRAVV